MRGYNSSNLTKIAPQTYDNSWVAAVVNRERVEILLNVGDENEHVMCFKVMAGVLEFIIINVYCQYLVSIEKFLRRIEDLINCFPTEKVLITLDANAKSVMWHADATDEKGALVEDLIIEHNLTVLNQPNNYPTFMNANGQSNIDITLTNANLVKHVNHWEVDRGCTTSDHNLIVIELQGNTKSNRNWNMNIGYNLQKANWQMFKELVKENFDENTTEVIKNMPAKKAVRMFNNRLKSICEKSIPKEDSKQISTLVE